MSARKPAAMPSASATPIGADAKGDLGEGSASYTNVDPGNPLRRSVMFSIRTSLAELASSRRKAVVQPPSDIFKQTRFSDLAGAKEAKGDLSSVILHSVSALSTKSTFGVPVGVDVTGVDPTTFSSTGRSFSTIIMPNIESHTARELQTEDTTVAYAFSQKYPHYNSGNLETLGVHPVASKNFVLVAEEHPIMAAIHENQSQLQNADMVTMPEGFVKISSSLFDAVLPVVKAQVASQVKVRDFSAVKFEISPAEHSTWGACLEAETMNALKPLKEERGRALARVGENAGEAARVNAEFDGLETQESMKLAHRPLSINMHADFVLNHLCQSSD